MKNLKLKSARAAKDLSQGDLAQLCGCSGVETQVFLDAVAQKLENLLRS